MSPLVSICVPLYNHQNFIIQLLDSIVEDSYENKEIVLINDGSLDDSDNIVQKWIAENENVKIYYKNRENKGLNNTVNELIDISSGKYILILASDDYLINNTIAKRVDILENNPTKLMLISDCIVVDDDNNLVYESASFQMHNGIKDNYFTDHGLKNEILYNWATVGPSYLYNKEIFSIIGRQDPNIYLGDWDRAVRAVSKNLILFYDEKVAAYRLHDNNTIKNKNAAIIFSESSIKTIKKYAHEFGISDRIRLWNKVRRLKRKIKKIKLKLKNET